MLLQVLKSEEKNRDTNLSLCHNYNVSRCTYVELQVLKSEEKNRDTNLISLSAYCTHTSYYPLSLYLYHKESNSYLPSNQRNKRQHHSLLRIIMTNLVDALAFLSLPDACPLCIVA